MEWLKQMINRILNILRGCHDQREKPWLLEPSVKKWQYNGLDLIIVRNALYGNLCGFVKLPTGHRDYGKDWSELYRFYRVHGGIDFSGRSIYHLPNIRYLASPKDGVWFIGFSCDGSHDIIPRDPLRNFRYTNQRSYKNLNFATTETERLADQVIARA